MEATNKEAAWAQRQVRALLRDAVQALLLAQLAKLGVRPRPLRWSEPGATPGAIRGIWWPTIRNLWLLFSGRSLAPPPGEPSRPVAIRTAASRDSLR